MSLWVHKEDDVAPHPVVGLVLQVGNAVKFPQALGLESLDPLLRVNKQGSCATTMLCIVTEEIKRWLLPQRRAPACQRQ